MQFITHVNQKGQLVIPAKIRKSLKITPDMPLTVVQLDEGVVVRPIKVVPYDLTEHENERSRCISQTQGSSSAESKKQKFLDLLDQVQGAWEAEAQKESQLRKKQRQKVTNRIKRLQTQW